MAEILGTAASVIQVAEVGFSLATTLYNYASSVKGAEKDIKKIARDVRLTSKVLESTHKQLKADQTLCTNDALFDLEEVLEGCKEAFQEVDNALNKTLRPGVNGKLEVSTMEKLKWPLRSSKLDVLRANLEKLKTTLLLMLSVLAYGSKISQSATKTDIKVEFSFDQLQIQSLVTAKDVATQRYEDLRAALVALEAKVSENTNQISMMTAPTGIFATTNLSQTPSVRRSITADNSDHRSLFAIDEHLELCAGAVSQLAVSIEAATHKWRCEALLPQGEILSHLHHVTTAIDELTEQHDELPPDLRMGIIFGRRKKVVDGPPQLRSSGRQAQTSSSQQDSNANQPFVRYELNVLEVSNSVLDGFDSERPHSSSEPLQNKPHRDSFDELLEGVESLKGSELEAFKREIADFHPEVDGFGSYTNPSFSADDTRTSTHGDGHFAISPQRRGLGDFPTRSRNADNDAPDTWASWKAEPEDGSAKAGIPAGSEGLVLEDAGLVAEINGEREEENDDDDDVVGSLLQRWTKVAVEPRVTRDFAKELESQREIDELVPRAGNMQDMLGEDHMPEVNLTEYGNL